MPKHTQECHYTQCLMVDGEAKPLVRQLAGAFKQTLEKQELWAAFKSGSKLQHSKGALRARRLTNRSLEKTKPALAILLNKVLYNTK